MHLDQHKSKGDAMDQAYHYVEKALESLVLVGAAVTALLIGIRRVYRTARNVEVLVEQSSKNATDLANFIASQQRHNSDRDKQIATLQHGVALAVKELSPNGGSSIKDVMTELRIEVAKLTQWKEDQAT